MKVLDTDKGEIVELKLISASGEDFTMDYMDDLESAFDYVDKDERPDCEWDFEATTEAISAVRELQKRIVAIERKRKELDKMIASFNDDYGEGVEYLLETA